MHFSIFSSKKIGGKWWRTLFAGFSIAIFLICGFEKYLFLKGYKAGIRDSPALWGMHRERVTWLKQPVVLIGASRIQLGIHVEELERLTGRDVIQLAIDGQNCLPVFENLATDKNFNGILIIDLHDDLLLKPITASPALNKWLEAYEHRHSGTIAPNIEAFLQGCFQIITTYHSIEMPIGILFERIMSGQSMRLYLKTDLKRDRYADYQLVTMPNFYINRVLRELGYIPDRLKNSSINEFQSAIEIEISSIAPISQDLLIHNIGILKGYSELIENRGGAVIFVRMPSDKLVLALEEARTPRHLVWDSLAKYGLKSLHFKDIPDAANFFLPDGSHLDQSQKLTFTRIIFNRLHEMGWIQSSTTRTK